MWCNGVSRLLITDRDLGRNKDIYLAYGVRLHHLIQLFGNVLVV